MKKITPVQGLTLFFLIGLSLTVLLLRDQIPLWRSLLFRYVVLFGILFTLRASSARTGRTGDVIEAFSPILFIVMIYESLGDLIQYLRSDIDACLIKIDFWVFGVHPTVWMERWIVPWLTDLMSVAYASYYFLPVGLIAALYLKHRREAFDHSVFVLVFGYYISFIGYVLFPAIGPRFTLMPLQSVPLEGSWITDFIREILNTLEHNKRDCMPSGHTQMALLSLYLAFRHEKVLFRLFLPFVCGVIFSTVYLRYHYVIDLFAGALLAAGCMIAGPKLYDWWERLYSRETS
jgi:membrane-associated phospholipid phosphatase